MFHALAKPADVVVENPGAAAILADFRPRGVEEDLVDLEQAGGGEGVLGQGGPTSWRRYSWPR
jgi:hypothetical protein